ncbi:crAss001_48 related protein [Ligilactobacillus equi]|uniref:Uncharacterized protein n=1 Tax=Ligilactobacillus equi DPC 6820 TaxID=1392007 RepID=V7HXY3_9LACO|nr:hypothetical protein [Ligilactobacillus equi]ETA74155.1 hypothetical protein LEQ_0534 [Ligilactobacillus equi DPC 6820]
MRKNAGLSCHFDPVAGICADEANKLASDIAKNLAKSWDNLLAKGGFKLDMDFKEQVRKEYVELTEKIGKLDDFVTKVLAGEIKEETVEKFELLERQLEVMKEYAEILEKRLDD